MKKQRKNHGTKRVKAQPKKAVKKQPREDVLQIAHRIMREATEGR